MERLNFSDCTLALLDKKFHTNQLLTSDALDSWLAHHAEITEFETQVLAWLQRKLIVNAHDWNETELIQNFIGPIFALVDYTTKRSNFFAERYVSGTVGDIELYGRPDGMIARGFRSPEEPYFCFHEDKKLLEQKGDPAGQCLAAMLVAQAINQHQHPVYGCYVVGVNWYFMLLQGQNYATRDDLSDIFRILKSLKSIILELVSAKMA